MPVVATNTAANSALNYLNKNSRAQSSSLQKIYSGSRIVTAKDDAAGLAVSNQIRADIATLGAAATNTSNAIAVLQTADGALARIGDIFARMKSLTGQAQSGAVDAASRGYINSEFQALLTEVDGISTSTRFNGTLLIDGLFNEDFLVGDTSTDIIAANLTTIDYNAAVLNANGDLVTTQVNAAAASVAVDLDIAAVSADRATLGALSSRFQFRGDVVSTAIENLTAAVSAISDVDIAAEQTRLVNAQVLTEAAIAGLSQANQLQQSLLTLIRQ